VDLQLKDKVVMVVGATGGIGAAVCEAFAAEGARLALVARDQGRLAELAAKLGGGDASHATFVCDLMDRERPAAVVREVEKQFGRLDVLVNCAGDAKRGGLDEITDADLEGTMQVKMLSPMRMARAALPGMRERKFGRIVMVGGLNGRNPSGDAVVGGAVNAGAANIGRQLAKANAAHGITVNTVDPGSTRTRRWELRLDQLQERHGITREEAEERASSQLLLKRPVEPQEIADTVVFLASPRTAALTGAIIPVDGGVAQGLY